MNATSMPLFEAVELHPRYRRESPLTSIDAAISVQASLPELQHAVLRFIKDQGRRGCTADELTKALGYYGRAPARTRRSELTTMGMVLNTGTTREMDTGRKAIVWAAKGEI